MKKKKKIIGFRFVRKHEHHIDFSDVLDDVELQPIKVVDILNS